MDVKEILPEKADQGSRRLPDNLGDFSEMVFDNKI